MKNCNVTEDDVKRMYDICVVDVDKMTRNTLDRVRPSIGALPA